MQSMDRNPIIKSHLNEAQMNVEEISETEIKTVKQKGENNENEAKNFPRQRA